ncbi:hypothetical protein LTR08_005344 [Meristemomyces frigidus]|nr:hypothetical protein LTR08_005344 [Meristemomyces frigidus]
MPADFYPKRITRSRCVDLENIVTAIDVQITNNKILLRVGLLNHPPQHLAFMHLVTKFAQKEARKVGRRVSQLRPEDTAALAEAFMEEYEQRLWPRELDREVRGHLNNPDFLESPENHTESTHVRYTVEGRYPIQPWEARDWRVAHHEEITQRRLRKDSQLAFLVRGLMSFGKTVDRTRTSLTQEELLELVLAGRGYDGKVCSTAEVVDTEHKVLKGRKDSTDPLGSGVEMTTAT